MPMASQALESVSVIPMASPTGSALASELEPRLDSGLEPESLAWASESVPGLEPEMLTGSDSVMPMASQALESVSDLVRDRTLHRLQIPSALSWR